MALRTLFFVAVAILAFRFTRVFKEDNVVEEESRVPGAGDGATSKCQEKIDTLDQLLTYTKDCLSFSKEGVECVSQKIEQGEEDGFPIAIECTPNLPEIVKRSLRDMLEIMNKKRDVEDRCRMNQSKQCGKELSVINAKQDQVIERHVDTLGDLHGPAEEAYRKFILLVNQVAGTFRK